jgi:transposase
MEKMEYANELQSTTVVAMRGCKAMNIFGSNRTLVADSWFASMATAESLHEQGLCFIGMVKQGHSLFPKKWLQQFAFGDDAERGAAFALHTKKKNTRYVAVGWNEPGKKDAKQKKKSPIKTLITTCLSICAGQPIIRKRTKGKKTNYIRIAQPLAVEGMPTQLTYTINIGWRCLNLISMVQKVT